MDSKKKRSSLRSAPMEKATTPQVKRRISFNGKKLVRIFTNDKCWDNSCEVSDHSADGSVAPDHAVSLVAVDKAVPTAVPPAAASTARQPQQQPLSDKFAKGRSPLQSLPLASVPPAADKENIPCDSLRQSNVSALYTTLDFINKPQRLSASVQIENSVDFTLLDRERMHGTSSFSLDEYDMDCLRRAGKPQAEEKQEISVTFDTHLDETGRKNDDTRCMTECVDESIFNEERDTQPDAKKTVAPITIFVDETMNETLVADGNQNKAKEEEHIKLTTTTYDQVAMQTDGSAEFENDFRGFLQTIIATPLKSAAMEISMLDASQNLATIGASRGGAHERRTINFSGEEEIEMSMLDAKQNLASVEERKVEEKQQQQTRKTINFRCGEDAMEMSIHDSRQIGARKGEDQQQRRISKDEMEISMHDSRQIGTRKGGDQQQRRISKDKMEISMHDSRQIGARKGGDQQQRRISKDEMEISMHDSRKNLVPMGERKGGAQQQHRKTINFIGEDAKLEETRVAVPSPKNEEQVKQRKTILFKNAGDSNKMDLTNIVPNDICTISSPPPPIQTETQTIIQHQHQAALPVPDKRHNAPKVVVVRKICTPLNHKTPQDIEKQRFMRCQKKLQHEELNNAPTIVQKNDTSKKNISIFDVSLAHHSHHSRHEAFSSPELSSPLLPLEYLPRGGNKKLNFRQLNHDIEHGKITIFPGTPKTPLAKRRALLALSATKSTEKSVTKNGQQNRKKSKIALTNFSAAVDLQLSPLETSLHLDEKPKMRKSYLNFNEADDLLLDNTSFLTKAKLGDETASRNSSKASCSQRRETPEQSNTKIASTSRQTLERFGEMELEVQETCASSRAQHKHLESSNAQEMDISVCPKEIKQQETRVELEQHQSKKIFNSKPRQTLLCFDDLDLDETNVATTKQEMTKNNVSKPRQTLHVVEDIDLDLGNISAKSNSDEAKPNVHISRQSQQRKTNVDDEMDCTLLTPNEIKQNIVTKKRQTLHFSDDIELEQDSNKVIQPATRQRQQQFSNVDEEVALNNCPQEMQLNITNKQETLLCTLNIERGENSNNEETLCKSRKTLDCFDDIDMDQSNVVNKSHKDLQTIKVSKPRQTLYLAEDIDSEATNIVPSSQVVKQNVHNSRQSQNVVEMDCTLLTSNEIKQNILTKRRQTLHFTEDIELELDSNTATDSANKEVGLNYCPNEIKQNVKDKQEALLNNKGIGSKSGGALHCFDNIDMDQSNVAIKSHQEMQKNKVSNPRQTIYLAEDIDFEAVNIMPKSNSIEAKEDVHNFRQSQHLKANVDDEMDCTLMTSNEIKQNIVTKKRQTLHFSDDIELEKDSNKVTESVTHHCQQQTSSANKEEDLNCCPNEIKQNMRKLQETFHSSVNITSNQNSNNSKGIVSISRKTLECFDDIDLDRSNAVEKNKVSNLRQTLYLAEDIDFEDVNTLPKSNLNGAKQNVHISKQLQQRKTNVDDEMDCTLVTSNIVKENIVTKKRQTIHFSNDIELEKDNNKVTQPATRHLQQQLSNIEEEIQLNITNRQETLPCEGNKPHSNNEEILCKSKNTLDCFDNIDMDQSNVIIKTHQGKEKNTVSNHRQTLYLAEDIDFEAANTVPNSKGAKQKFHNSRQLPPNVAEEMDCTLVASNEIKQNIVTENKPNIVTKKRQTLHFTEDIALDDSNIAIESDDHLSQFKSPVMKSALQQRSNRWCEGTPHRSLIDFELLERKLQLEEDKVKTTKSNRASGDAAKGAIPKHSNANRRHTTYEPADIVLDISGLRHIVADADASYNSHENREISLDKRSAMANLTPNLPQSKKRQTVIFSDCGLDTTVTTLTTQATKSARNKLDLVVDGKKQRSTLFLPEEMQIDDNGERKGVEPSFKSASPQVIEIFDDETENVCSELCTRAAYEASPTQLRQSDARPAPILNSGARKSISTSINTKNKYEADFNISAANDSLNTIEIPRKQAIHTAASLRKSRSIPMFDLVHNDVNDDEENPITISDVSTHFLAQRKSAANNRFPSEIKSFVELTLCNTSRRSSGGSSAAAGTKRRTLGGGDNSFLHLTLPELDEIEKTRMSLVETLLDSDTPDDDEDEEDEDEHFEEDCQQIKTKDRTLVATVGPNASILCNKCKRCQHTLSNETISTTCSSFALPALPALNIGLEELERLRNRPTIDDVQEYYRRLELSQKVTVRDLFTPDGKVDFALLVNDDDEEDEEEEEQENEIDIFLAKFESDWESIENRLSEEALKPQQRAFFEVRLDDLISERLPGWIFNYQMRNILQFSYHNLMQLCVVIVFEDKAGLGLDIDIKNVQLQNNRMPEKNWKPYDFMLHFQAKLELSLDLRLWCAGNTEMDVLEMMEKIDQVFAKIVKTGRELWKLVINEQASLVRNANRIYVRKIVRKIVTPEHSYTRVEATEFSIEVMNFKKICFKDIVKPPLHLFREDIQHLPTGLEFLRVFLKDPCSYLKH